MDKQAQIEHGGPAFPCDRINVNGGVVCTTGMTLRDHFAGLAMQAVPMQQGHLHDIPECYARIAQHAYKMADAMLEART